MSSPSPAPSTPPLSPSPSFVGPIAPASPQEREAEVIRQENLVFADALARGYISQEQYDVAMAKQNARLNDNVVSATTVSPATQRYVATMREQDSPVLELYSQVPTGASNLEFKVVPFVGPPAPNKTYADYPSSLQLTYTNPPAPAVQASPNPTTTTSPPNSLSDNILATGEQFSRLSNAAPVGGIQNPITQGIRGLFGMDPRPNPLAAEAGVVAAFENLAYNAPRTTISTVLDFVGQFTHSQAQAQGANMAAQIAFNQVIPRPPPTVTSGVVSAVMGGGTEQLDQATKNPSYAAGTIIGDVLASLAIGHGLNVATGGTMATDLQGGITSTQNSIRQTRWGANLQDRLNMDYRVAVELGEDYKPSLGDRVLSKVTGIKAQEPAQGSVGLPNLETAKPSAYYEYQGTREVQTSTLVNATNSKGQVVDSFMIKGPSEVPATFKGEMGDLYQVANKKQMGLDAFDFMDAPNTSGVGYSFSPIEKADRVARPTGVYWFDGKQLVPSSALRGMVNDPDPYAPPKDSRVNRVVEYDKQNLPSLEQVLKQVETMPIEATNKVPNSVFYKNNPWTNDSPFAVGAGAKATTETVTENKTTGTDFDSFKSKGGAILEGPKAETMVMPWELLTGRQKNATVQDEDFGSTQYPASGLAYPPILGGLLGLGMVNDQRVDQGVGLDFKNVGDSKVDQIVGPINFSTTTTTPVHTTVKEIEDVFSKQHGSTLDIQDLKDITITGPRGFTDDVVTPIYKEVPVNIIDETTITDLPDPTKPLDVTPTFNPNPTGGRGIGGFKVPDLGGFSLGGGGRRGFKARGGYGQRSRIYPIMTGADFLNLGKGSFKKKSAKKKASKSGTKKRKGH